MLDLSIYFKTSQTFTINFSNTNELKEKSLLTTLRKIKNKESKGLEEQGEWGRWVSIGLWKNIEIALLQ